MHGAGDMRGACDKRDDENAMNIPLIACILIFYPSIATRLLLLCFSSILVLNHMGMCRMKTHVAFCCFGRKVHIFMEYGNASAGACDVKTNPFYVFTIRTPLKSAFFSHSTYFLNFINLCHTLYDYFPSLPSTRRAFARLIR